MNFYLVYFIYGLSFFSLGLAMALESGRSPLMAEARVLWPLAAFGLLHGSHEWLEMALLSPESLSPDLLAAVGWAQLAMLSLSFMSLVAFGLRVLRPERRPLRRELLIAFAVLGLYALLVVALRPAVAATSSGRELFGDMLARYTLGLLGALLAGLALYRQSSQAARAGHGRLSKSLAFAALCFALYGLTQAFVQPLPVFPASLVNSQAFLRWTGLPVQLVRAGLAVGIVTAMIVASQLVEEERQRQLLTAQQARLEAMQRVERELVEREAMRRELLRHTVIAQEDERARIARELHDETAQVLSAFSLHLAALRDSSPSNGKQKERIDQLQELCRSMSQGLYRMVRDLRPAQLDDLGLGPALQYLADEERRRSGLQVDVSITGERQRLDPIVETVFFRVAQEALSNVVRHAGVSRARIELQYSPEAASLRVSDAGAGFDPEAQVRPPRGWGLAGMRERSESVGGQLQIRSAIGGGTTVEMVVPLVEREISASEGDEVWAPSA